MAFVNLERDIAMNRIFKTLVVSATLVASVVASTGTASAGDRYWRQHRHHNGGGDAVAAGVAGLAVGALLGSALAAPRQRQYIDDYPVYEEPAPVYRRTRVIISEPAYVDPAPMRPWSRSWMRYCSQRYRSFDPGTGTYVGYDGEEHFCEG